MRAVRPVHVANTCTVCVLGPRIVSLLKNLDWQLYVFIIALCVELTWSMFWHSLQRLARHYLGAMNEFS